MRSIAIRSLACLTALWCTPAAAQTTTAAVMPATGGHREIPAEAQREARQAAVEYLRTEDLLVLDDTRVETSLDEAQRACVPGTDCMTDARSALGVDLLVGLILWGSSDARDRPSTVHATILDGTGARFLGTAEVARGVPTAVRDALRAALESQRRGPGPFLEIAGTRGAIVELDGAAIGSIPLEDVRTEPGEHELHVTMPGHEPQTLTVAVGDDPARTTRVEVELRREGAGGGGTPGAGGGGVASWAMPVGIGGIVAGLGLGVGVPVGGVASTGCDEEQAGGACARFTELDVGAAVAWGVAGGVLAALGVVLVIVAAAEDGEGSVSARVGPTGASIEGSF